MRSLAALLMQGPMPEEEAASLQGVVLSRTQPFSTCSAAEPQDNEDMDEVLDDLSSSVPSASCGRNQVIHGLINKGNSCWANALLQALVSLPLVYASTVALGELKETFLRHCRPAADLE